jgi:SsrA-binding protein
MAVLIQNRKVRFDYEVLEKYQAGIELLGFEVKSLKNKRGNLDGSYITIKNGEAFVASFDIPPYQPSNTPEGYDSRRVKRLLLTKKEIKKLINSEKQKGLTIVPISVYTKNNKIKLELAVVRGKKKYDKREVIKKRETERELRRELKAR